MISLETIEREISELEARETSYKLCERLSWLYIVRDHLKEKIAPTEPSRLQLEGSEFLELASKAPYEDVLKVMDEHMQTLQTLFPKSYDTIIDRIRGLTLL